MLCAFVNSKDDRLPNLDATQQVADTENNEQIDVPTRERKHFHANINKIGHVIFSVSCIIMLLQNNIVAQEFTKWVSISTIYFWTAIA